jgi:hypothetical protein
MKKEYSKEVINGGLVFKTASPTRATLHTFGGFLALGVGLLMLVVLVRPGHP